MFIWSPMKTSYWSIGIYAHDHITSRKILRKYDKQRKIFDGQSYMEFDGDQKLLS